MILRLVLATVSMLLAVALLTWWRDFPPRLAILAGVAIGGLVFAALGTSVRLRQLYQNRRSP